MGSLRRKIMDITYVYCTLWAAVWLRVTYLLFRGEPIRLQTIAILFVAFTVAIGLVHAYIIVTRYGGGDAYNYFNDGLVYQRLFLKSPFGFIEYLQSPAQLVNNYPELGYINPTKPRTDAGNITISLAASISSIFAGDSYYANAVLWGGLVGFCMLVVLKKCISPQLLPISLLFFLSPTIGFFPFGYSKEALLLLVLIAAVYAAQRFSGTKRLLSFAIIAVSLMLVRYEYLMLILPSLLFVYAVHYLSKKLGFVFAALAALLLPLLIVAIDVAALDYSLLSKVAAKRLAYPSGGSDLNLPFLDGTSYLANLTTLGAGAMQAIMPVFLVSKIKAATLISFVTIGLEVTVLVSLASKIGWGRDASKLLIATYIALVVMASVIPNAGTLVRFRAPMVIICYLALVGTYANQRSDHDLINSTN